MKCEHETCQLIPIKKSMCFEADTITIDVKIKCEFCKKIIGYERKVYRE